MKDNVKRSAKEKVWSALKWTNDDREEVLKSKSFWKEEGEKKPLVRQFLDFSMNEKFFNVLAHGHPEPEWLSLDDVFLRFYESTAAYKTRILVTIVPKTQPKKQPLISIQRLHVVHASYSCSDRTGQTYWSNDVTYHETMDNAVRSFMAHQRHKNCQVVLRLHSKSVHQEWEGEIAEEAWMEMAKVTAKSKGISVKDQYHRNDRAATLMPRKGGRLRSTIELPLNKKLRKDKKRAQPLEELCIDICMNKS